MAFRPICQNKLADMLRTSLVQGSWLLAGSLLLSVAVKSETLTLDEVRALARSRFPMVAAAEKTVDKAEGDLLSAEGEFDVKWKTKHHAIVDGYYENDRIVSIIEQPTTFLGTTLYAGYRKGTGEFALYDGKAATNPGGEFLAGLNVPLWRDGLIDARRANINKSRAGLGLAEIGLKQSLISTVAMASYLYWDWVGAAQKVEIYQKLLNIAEGRFAGLQERVKVGDLPVFELQDNQGAILSRKAQLVQAERAIEKSAIALSLYLRTDSGKPVMVERSRALPQIPLPQVNDIPASLVEEALAARPEFGAFRQLRDQNKVDRALALNQQGPKIDVNLQVASSLKGDDISKEPGRFEAGVVLEVPLQANIALGKARAAAADLIKLDIKENYFRDRVIAEVNDLRSALTAATERVALARSEAQLARELEEGEREKFLQGASNQLFVNIREKATADASSREVDALVEYHKGIASLHAAIGRSH